MDWDGIVRRKHRRSFERFLSHPDERVRAYATERAEHDARTRDALRRERLAEEEAAEAAFREAEAAEVDFTQWTDEDIGF